MKKRKINNKMDCISMQNPVAKFAHRFNKAQIFCDNSKYRRKSKHSKQESFSIILAAGLLENSPAIC
jgi:hypothetical protein